ncbi:hypothetical protein ACFX1X_020401 [Malus domestica]
MRSISNQQALGSFQPSSSPAPVTLTSFIPQLTDMEQLQQLFPQPLQLIHTAEITKKFFEASKLKSKPQNPFSKLLKFISWSEIKSNQVQDCFFEDPSGTTKPFVPQRRMPVWKGRD